MKFIIGKKIDMTQVWKGDVVIAVTRIQAGPCVATQVKTEDKDKYTAVQLGFGKRKEKNINKAQKGHMKDLGNFSHLREFRISSEEVSKLKKGDKINADTFVSGDIIKVTGVSKGRGFQGVVKRHGFSGSKKTHGNKDQLRMPGSVGSTGPAHVFKGMRMGGRMGGKQISTTNMEIVDVDKENNIILIKGAVPGARNSLVLIQGDGELKLAVEKQEEAKEVKAENETKEEVKTEEKNSDKKVETAEKSVESKEESK